MKAPRRNGANDGGQPVNGSLAEARHCDDPRARKPLGSNRSRQARSISASLWRHLARVVPQEDWDSL